MADLRGADAMTSGEKPARAGRYIGKCDAGHAVEAILAKGEPLPPCGTRISASSQGTAICESPVLWEFAAYVGIDAEETDDG